jgi:hypothetical protein
VKAAGLDPDKALSEQLIPSDRLDEETVKGWITEAVAEAMGAQDSGNAGESTDPQVHERRFAEGYARALDKSRSRWFGEDGGDDAA